MDTYEFKITRLKAGVKNPERMNVYINNEFGFSLDLTQVVDLKLKVGQVISSEELEKIKKESEFGKIYQRTLKWVLLRPRSERETVDYLRKQSQEKDYARRIIERLKERGYLDDEEFACFYVENRFVKKGISSKRLKMELLKKGIAEDIIDGVLGVRNDESEICKIIMKKRAKYTDEKLMAYLCRQGFSYELVKEEVEKLKD